LISNPNKSLSVQTQIFHHRERKVQPIRSNKSHRFDGESVGNGTKMQTIVWIELPQNAMKDLHSILAMVKMPLENSSDEENNRCWR
jgi:hypothetical protein